jgi:hypothetical protein
MYPILECAVCAVVVTLMGGLLFAAGVGCIVVYHGVQAIVHTAHKTLATAPQTSPRVAALEVRGAGTWLTQNALKSFRDMNSTS